MSRNSDNGVPIEGTTIESVRQMTDEEIDREYWQGRGPRRPPVLVLENGVRLYPSRDPEGNGPGELFGVDADGDPFMVDPE